MYLHRKMLHLPVALNPKEMVGDMSLMALMATFHYTPSLRSLGPSHVPAQADVVLASGPELKGDHVVGAREPGHRLSHHPLVLLGSLFQVYSEHISKFMRVTHRPTNQPNSRLYI